MTADQALLTLGGQVLESLDDGSTVSDAWASVKSWRAARGIASPVPFWWFALAIDCLFTLGGLEFVDHRLKKVERASEPQ